MECLHLIPCLVLLLLGCVQPGVQRPNPQDYALEVAGLTLVDSESLDSSEVLSSDSCLNHDTVLLYYSEHDNPELKNYIVRLVLNESRPQCLSDFNYTNGLYYKHDLTEQYAWFFDKGLVIIEGTYSNLGGVEYDELLLEVLVNSYLEKFSLN